MLMDQMGEVGVTYGGGDGGAEEGKESGEEGGKVEAGAGEW